jgi:hypothetical protein
VHITAKILGHESIATTQTYVAIYDQDVIDPHRAFIAGRRALRPSEEYREPTDSEWDEFLGHFAARKLELGTCGRANGTGCQHEHSCIRCPMLCPDPTQQSRLEEIIANLTERITEATEHGWLGDVDGLTTSLNAAKQKLTEMRRTATNLGMPTTAPRLDGPQRTGLARGEATDAHLPCRPPAAAHSARRGHAWEDRCAPTLARWNRRSPTGTRRSTPSTRG